MQRGGHVPVSTPAPPMTVSDHGVSCKKNRGLEASADKAPPEEM